MKRKALRVRSEGSIHPYVTEAESRKQHSDSPLCNSLDRDIVTLDRDGRTTVRLFYKSLLVRFSNRVDSVLSEEILLSLHRNEPVEVVRLTSS